MHTGINAAVAIAIMALVTLFLRAIPFLLFNKRQIPAYIRYLGQVLPFSMMGLLVVYCLRGTKLLERPFGIPEGLSILVVVGLHLWKKNTVFSVIVGTVVYMMFIRIM